MTSIDDSVLQSYGGLNQNSLISVLNAESNEELELNAHLQMIRNSQFYDNDMFIEFIRNKKEHFIILSSNIESVSAKFDELTIFINNLREVDFEFGAICLQECWLSENVDLSHIQLEGYTCISLPSIVGKKRWVNNFS